MELTFPKRVADQPSENWSKMDRNRMSEQENYHLLLQNLSQGIWERFGMVLDPKIPYQISKNIDFRVSGVDGGPGGSVALLFYDKDLPIVPR